MNTKKHLIICGLALIIVIIGFVVSDQLTNASDQMQILPYLVIAFFAAIFSLSMSELGNSYPYRKLPQEREKQEIEANDERNIYVRLKAKEKAFDAMAIAFGSLIIAFLLKGLPFYVSAIFIATYLLIFLIYVVYLFIYKEL